MQGSKRLKLYEKDFYSSNVEAFVVFVLFITVSSNRNGQKKRYAQCIRFYLSELHSTLSDKYGHF